MLFLCFAKYCFVQICDMVTVARYLNLTMVIPELDKQSFWADPRCAFCPMLSWSITELGKSNDANLLYFSVILGIFFM